VNIAQCVERSSKSTYLKIGGKENHNTKKEKSEYNRDVLSSFRTGQELLRLHFSLAKQRYL